MKLNVRAENGLYQIIGDDENSTLPSGWSVTIPTIEHLKDLRDKIDQVIADSEKPETEVVWNPRSQRHETIVKRGK